ncbi:metallophosphoesterase protein [Geoanaerobacter pelophilus]|uniref:Metallophosphoesterase protein n=1 Tax=Geoanaerobacter pelophilus TaxID=60036 RepID=A0ABQ0MEG1_9BACT|nr:metallophosphoesterase [Geoanaerobacter pelophilus]GAW65500.1 metallophosphoesterase protein [Geoanaerobacter pelophilus]
MKFLLLHLSDMHLKETDGFIVGRAESIAACLYDQLYKVNRVFVAITGDVANSGKQEEYHLAKEFLNKIKCCIQRERNVPVSFVITAGNHDCDFSKPTSIRDTLIREMQENGEKAIDDEKIEECVKVQKNFFAFRNEIASENVISDDNLIRHQHFDNSSGVTFWSINVSWMSQVREKQGQMVFPTSKYKKGFKNDGALSVVLLHHPLNWYAQGTYHPLKQLVKSAGTIVVSGHEHTQGASDQEDIYGNQNIFIEGGAIKPHEKTIPSAFNIIMLDMENNKYLCEILEWNGTIYVRRSTAVPWREFREIAGKKRSELEPDPSFEQRILEVGAIFSHPGKSTLTLPDIFVYPDLRELIDDKKAKRPFSAKELADNKYERVILRGQDKSGKTSLLLTLFSRFVSNKEIPLFIGGSSISKVSEQDLAKLIEKLVTAQYGAENLEAYKQLPSEKKVLLLDDLDKIVTNEKARSKIISFFEERYKRIFITTGDFFDIKELISPETVDVVKDFKSYDVLPFGHVRRLELIQKWYNIGEFCFMPDVELNLKVDQAEKILNTVLGKNLIPSVPIYLLALLQSIESGQKNRLENSAFGHYYNYLISDALKEIALRPDEWDEFYNYCSQLAWECNQLKKRELDEAELRAFTDNFSQKYHPVDFAVRIKQLSQAKLLVAKDGYYSFSYPYIYYFFLGKYLATNINNSVVVALIDHYCDHLYVSDYANSILFLTHFSKEDKIINRIVNNLCGLFNDKLPVQFEKDTVKFNELLDDTAKLIIEDTDIYENRKTVNGIKDNNESEENVSELVDQAEVNDIAELDLFSKINLLFKTIDIIGQILKSYYGSLTNPQKETMLTEVFDAPLRALKDFVDYISEDKEALIKEVEGWIKKEGKKLEQVELKAKARKGIFNTVGMFNFVFLYKTSNAIASEQLAGVVRRVVKNNPSLSYKLIELGTKLELPGKMPIEEIKNLKILTDGNVFARRILETYIVHHMYMFKTDIRDKQRIGELLDIQVGLQRTIDIKSQHQKRIG